MEDKSLLDTLHKCLKCNDEAYEFEPGKFKCSTCGFTWEIVHIEEV